MVPTKKHRRTRVQRHATPYTHLSSTTTPSGGMPAPSVAAVESTMDKGFHPKPEHGWEHHDDVFKKRAAPSSVTIVGARAQSFRPVVLMCHHEVFRRSMTSSCP